MKRDTYVSEYFLKRRPESGSGRSLYTRIINGVVRHQKLNNKITMSQLCAMSEKELKKIRNIGEKARTVILEECANYKITLN